VNYKRSPIEIESPEQYGYDKIKHNLSESSFTDMRLSDLDISLDDIVLAYGNHLGKPELRGLIAAEGAALHADDVMLTPGAAAALFIVNTVLLKPDDHIVAAFPNYATNLTTPRAIGCNLDLLTLRFEDGWRLDLEALAQRITPKTKLLSLTTPHNPTGVMLSEADLRRVVELVEANGCYLLLDETYREMAFGGLTPLGVSLSPRVISISSLSKSYGLPGIRMGWLICQDQALMQQFLAAKEQIFISGSLVDEEIAFQALRRKSAMLDEIRAKIAINFEAISGWMSAQSQLEWVQPQGGVVCFPRIRLDLPVNLDTFYQLLNHKYGTWVGPGHWFEHDRRYMRIGYGWTSRDTLLAGLNTITQAINDACQD